MNILQNHLVQLRRPKPLKILLINPPFYRFLGLEQDYVPISLVSVGTAMVEEGHEVYLKNLEVGENMYYVGYAQRASDYDKFVNAIDDPSHFIWQELRDTIEEVQPDKIGVTVLNVKFKAVLKVIEIADSYGIPVIVGGQHPTTEPNIYPKHVEVFTGEYEASTPEFPGLEKNRLKDLNEIALPNYDILVDKYSPNGYGHIMSSRGCPYLCTFCASNVMWDQRVTFKSIDRIVEEMAYAEETFQTDFFTFWDETWTMDKKRVYEFCSKYNLDAKWRCDTRADSIDDEMIKAMKEANLGQMSIGVETSDDETLKRIGKVEYQEDFIRAAQILGDNNIQWKAYMIIGFPTDTEKMIFDSIEFVKTLKPFRITLSFFTPYKGTALYDEVEALGLINQETYESALFSHQSPHNYFCPNIPKERFMEIREIITKDVDDYNKEALKVWR